MKRFFILAVLVSASSARADVAAWGPVATRAGTAWTVGYPSSGVAIAAANRAITAGATAVQAVVQDVLNIAGPAGNLAVKVATTVTSSEVALGAARFAARAAVPIGVGMALYDLYKGSGIRWGDKGLEMDPGTPSTTKDVVVYWVDSRAKANSKSAACTAYAALLKSTGAAGSVSDPVLGYVPYDVKGFLVTDPAGDRCQVQTINPITGAINAAKFRYEGFAQQVTQEQSCGNGNVRADGLCETGVYSPADEANLAKQLQRLIDKTSPIDAANKLLGSGGMIPTSSAPVVTGPASQVGAAQTTNTTGPAGTVSSTVTPTYNYNYAGDTITYNTVNNTVTNTTGVDGKTQTTTESKPVQADTKQLCELYPSSLACIAPGEAPAPDALPVLAKSVDFSPDARWGAGAGSCSRGPVQLSFGSFDLWKPFCDWASMIRGVVIAGFSLAAAAVFLSGVRAQ